MKETSAYTGIAAIFLAASIIYAVDHPEAVRKQAEVLINNRAAVIPKPQEISTVTVIDIRKI